MDERLKQIKERLAAWSSIGAGCQECGMDDDVAWLIEQLEAERAEPDSYAYRGMHELKKIQQQFNEAFKRTIP